MDKDLVQIQEFVHPLVVQAESYKITSVEEVEAASAFMKKLSDTSKRVEAKRLSFTAPLNKSLTEINNSFRSIQVPLKTAQSQIVTKILDWRRAESARIEKEEARRVHIQEAHVEQGHQAHEEIVMARPENTIGNAQVSKVWTFEVMDKAQVPEGYKTINPVLVREAIRTGVREIAGIRIFQEEHLAAVEKRQEIVTPF
jgi:hypothetical protein